MLKGLNPLLVYDISMYARHIRVSKVLLLVVHTDRATKERALCDKNRRQKFPGLHAGQIEQKRLIKDLSYGLLYRNLF